MSAREPGTYIELDDAWADPGWVRVPNTIARCTTISRGAKGFVLELASHAPGRRMTIADMVASSTDGRDATRARITELEQAGFLTRHRERDSNGQLGAVIYRLHVTPQTPRSEPTPGFPTLVNPTLDNPVTSNKTKDLEDKEPKTSTSATPDGDADDAAQAPLLEAGVGVKPSQEQKREDVEQLCELLAGLIVKNGSPRAPVINKGWRDAARLLLDRDKRPLREVRYVIEWCQRDEFWRTNILSMPTLRKQYDRLVMRAKQEWTESKRRQQGPGEQRRGAHGEEVLVNGRWVLDRSALPADDWRRWSEQ